MITSTAPDIIRANLLFLYIMSKTFVVLPIINERKGLFFSLTFFEKSRLDITGARVSENISAPRSAKPRV